jgi:hypothetical protein
MEEELSALEQLPPSALTSDVSCLRTFSRWLEGMPAEVTALCDVLENAPESPSVPEECRRASAESLALLIRSIQLIPDGIEALGYLENLFAFRAIMRDAATGLDTPADDTSRRLAAEAELVAGFLGDDFGRLRQATRDAREHTRAGQRATDLLVDAERRSAAIAQLRAWARAYRAPELAPTEAEALKLRSFLRVRLGAS